MRKSVALISAILLIVSVASAQSAQAAKAGLLSAAEVKKVLPSDFFFSGQVAPVQARNSAGIRFADKKLFLIAMVDTAGYSSNIAEKYQGMLITEAAVSIGGSNLPAGVYGFGTSPDGKFNVMNMAGEQVLTVATETDSAIAHPVPLTMSEDGGKYRLYLGRKHVTISR